ncbi:MAG: hypothetical protein WC899_12535 [bacterium]|jgi:hypothetical protein
MKPSPGSARSWFLFFPALAAALLLSPAAGASLAAGPPGATATAATDNAAGAVVPAADNGWVDRTHSRVERNLFDTVAWFDRFFGDERMEVTERPESFLRWTNELRWDEEEHFSFRSTVRASVRLPRLKKRWRLVISGETKGDPNAVTQEDPGNPGLDVGSRTRTGSTELVYDLLRTPRSSLDVGAGVRVKLPPDAFVRTRFQHARPIGLETLGRFTIIGYWDARDGFGESNQVDLERWLAPPTLLRWSNSLAIVENRSGWTWGSELSLLHKLSPKSAVTFAGGASGSSRPAWIATNYRVLARYRRNVWRKWLFLEGEPDIRWPRKEDGSRKPVWGAVLRAEILFNGAGPDLRVGEGSGP